MAPKAARKAAAKTNEKTKICQAIIENGKNEGKRCTNKASEEYGFAFCGTHKGHYNRPAASNTVAKPQVSETTVVRPVTDNSNEASSSSSSSSLAPPPVAHTSKKVVKVPSNAETTERAGVSYTVATWNVRHLTICHDNPLHNTKLDNIRQSIQDCRADIIVLQEVDNEKAVNMLCADLNKCNTLPGDKGWCYAVSPRLSGTGEMAAFVWRHGRRIKLLGVNEPDVNAEKGCKDLNETAAFKLLEDSHPDKGGNTSLTRAVYTGKFRLCDEARTKGIKDLILHSVHLATKDSNAGEIGATLPRLLTNAIEPKLPLLAEQTGKKPAKQPLVVVLGDFNRGAGDNAFNNMKKDCDVCPLLPAGVPTNSSGDEQFDNAWVPATQRSVWSEAKALEFPKAVAGKLKSVYSDHQLVYMSCTV